MSNVKSLQCRECGSEYPVEPQYVCDFCFGPLEVSYDYDAVARVISRERITKGPLTMWRYHDLLPVDAEMALDMQTGFTPLIRAKNLGRLLGLNNLYIKNDSVNPTFSFKDRVVSVASAKALEFEFDTLACASTGNLAGSVSAHGAKAGMNTMVFFPSDLERGKILGAGIYGATLVAVDGTYDQVNRLCSELADNHRWAFVNINMRPFYSEGQQDARIRGGGAAWLARAGRLRGAGGFGVAVHKDIQGTERACRPGADRFGGAHEDAHSAGRGLLAHRDGIRRGYAARSPCYAGYYREVSRHRQSGGWLLLDQDH